jgi:2-dehydro-3-deoxy-D-arabinonate dehydratase
MLLTRHQSKAGPRWALDGRFLPASLSLSLILELPAEAIPGLLDGLSTQETAAGDLLPPIEPLHEVWACGVTYLRSREARVAEARTGDIYEQVYQAERPELFFKATGARVVGHGRPVRVRSDSSWNVPEPELVLLVNRFQEIVGYSAGNDVSSRSIEAENPLYLPQAKIYRGSCAIGPGIRLCPADEMRNLEVNLDIARSGERFYQGETSIAKMKRPLEELVGYLFREQSFPHGAFLLTGTGIVPPDEFSLLPGDRVAIRVGELVLENSVL